MGQLQMRGYILETVQYIRTVRDFCDCEEQWSFKMDTEMKKLSDIQSLELDSVLKEILEGLMTLQNFLDAVENLAVTSLYVFDKRYLPEDMSVEFIQSMIGKARAASPLLVLFKRDNSTFFRPVLSNVDILDFQLHKYINTTKWLCMEMNKQQVFTPKVKKPMVNMTDHLTQLIQIRKDEPFRLTFLFNHRAQDFIDSYSECQSRMFQYLSDLEEAAVELERMFLGSSISSLAGSSVGFLGGALSIAGLVLAPFTAGVSLWLTAGGAVLGLTSGVNSLATCIAEAIVNSRESNKANDIFKDFMADVQKVLDCIELVACSKRDVPHLDEFKVSGVKFYEKLLYTGKEGFKAGKDIRNVHRALKNIKTEKAARAEAHVALGDVTEVRRIPRTSKLPNIGQIAKGTPLALSKSARVGNMITNALFIGVDIFFICKESISLARGDKCEASQVIRSRSTLWRSEIEAWGKMHDSLCKGKDTFQAKLDILEQPFIH